MADKIKLLLAALVLGSALGAFYYFSDQSVLLRTLGMVVAVVIAAAIALQSTAGTAALAFARGATTEVRKVVWPSRKETIQTTGIVMLMVVLVGIILWLFDLFLGWAVTLFTGQGG